MQLQIEYNPIPSLRECCLICTQRFEMTEARVIACNEQGKRYGNVCPECLEKGFYWLEHRFQQLNSIEKVVAVQQSRPPKTRVGV